MEEWSNLRICILASALHVGLQMSPLLLGSCTHQFISASFAPCQAGRTVKAASHGHLRRRVMVDCSAEDKRQLERSA